jgi:threonine synthase
MSMEFVCTECRTTQVARPEVWRCTSCGGIFDLKERRPFRAEALDTGNPSLWRYRAMLGIPQEAHPVTLGEGMTPLLPVRFGGRPVHFKVESLAPTASFKDRGTSVLVTTLRAWGVSRAADDSSGNAGASFAAYAAHAGLAAEVFTPAHASAAKLAQIEVFGATLNRIEGVREKATEALEEAARRGLVYASHAWSPFTLEGTKTIAYELWEQLSGRVAGPAMGAAEDGVPDYFICPVGQGSMLLGVYRGFKDLQAAGLIRRLPKIIAVQSVGCPPIVEALHQGLDRAVAIEKRPSVAEGIMLARPLRDREILRAIRESGGCALAVTDEETMAARKALARTGLFVEPTSAVVAAALQKLDLRGVLVAGLTGSGLKSPA